MNKAKSTSVNGNCRSSEDRYVGTTMELARQEVRMLAQIMNQQMKQIQVWLVTKYTEGVLNQ